MSASTYSFLDTAVAYLGKNGAVLISGSAGVAEEGITIEPSVDTNVMTIGADGRGQHSLVVNRSATIRIRLLKSSPINTVLEKIFSADRADPLSHGRGSITINNPSLNDSVVCTGVAFKRLPNINYAGVGDMLEWTFDAVSVQPNLGTSPTGLL